MKGDASWYQTAIIYEVQIRSFFDSDGDGIGDFRGLTQKLDYFEHLGVTALWLLPFYPSPLRDDGYDIADYYSVHPSYGTLEDFREFLAAAHQRGLRVITELVLNHTSDLNPWFQAARHAEPGSAERDFYVWSDTTQKYTDARIIFRDFEMSNWTWDPVAGAYFWHRFYSHQPDLNFDNPKVCEALFGVIDFWLEMGVDGLRLDAVPYLYEREGTSCENLPETHEFLKRLRAHVDAKFPGRMLLAEANQWPEDAVAYFGEADECHMAFHFPLMPRLFMGVQMEDRFPILDILDQTPAIPKTCQWAIFLRNHDELTLEMVTDEERDYMYRIYAEDPRARINLGIRRRLAPLLGNNRRKIELLNSLLLSLPGTPIIYYGDELGMGDNFYLGDRNGVRTPMQWSADRNAGFSRANPQQVYLPVIIDPEYHYETVNVENQVRNLSSLFWWTRRILNIRKRWRAFALGSLSFLECENAKVLAFVREHGDETILVVANLSRFAQSAIIDLSAYAGRVPEELFGHSRFPELTETPSPFLLGPHGFYWFALRKTVAVEASEDWTAPELELDAEVSADLWRVLETDVLPAYLGYCRWFGAKERTQRDLRIIEKIPLSADGSAAWLVLFEVSFVDGDAQTYVLPLAFAPKDTVDLPPVAILAHCDGQVLCDALYLPKFRTELFQWTAGGACTPPNGSVRLQGSPADGSLSADNLASRLVPTEQSNTSIVYGEQWFLKFIRRLEDGINPEAMILRHLEKQNFMACPPYAGEISLLFEGRRRTAALLTGYVKNQGDGWKYTLDSLARFMERVVSSSANLNDPESVNEAVGAVYLEKAVVLGMRLGELHCALAASNGDAYFEPEPFTGPVPALPLSIPSQRHGEIDPCAVARQIQPERGNAPIGGTMDQPAFPGFGNPWRAAGQAV